MLLDSIQTEQTTAITDLLMGLLAIGFAYFILNFKILEHKTKCYIWAGVYGFIAVASLLGFVVHGLILGDLIEIWLWKFINMSLGLAVGLFFIAVVYEIRNYCSLPFVLTILCTSVLFCIISEVYNSFFILILYQGVALIIAFFSYSYLALTGRIKGGWLMVTGILICIVAAVIQAMGPFELKIIWFFNHNGIFHIIETLGLFIIYLGLRADLMPKIKNL